MRRMVVHRTPTIFVIAGVLVEHACPRLHNPPNEYFELNAPGLVTARNESYEDADEHSDRVNVENSVPIACECPADTILRRGMQAPCDCRNS